MIEPTDNLKLRKATVADKELIWKILEKAVERRKNEGSSQWQDGYPNPGTIEDDLKNEVSFVFEFENEVAGYAAIIFDKEPAYEILEGKWLNSEKYAVIHRVAISEKFLGKGFATKFFVLIEEYVKSKNIFNIKIDTKYDNLQMLKIMGKLDYKYCGEVYFRESARKAFQKILI